MFGLKKQKVTTGIPIWQGKNLENAQGGFTLEDEYSAGETIPAGTPIGFNESTRKAKVAKIAVLHSSATSSEKDYKVLKGHVLELNMKLKFGSATPKTVTKIDRTNADYDLITLNDTLGVEIPTGGVLFVDDEGFSTMKGLLYESVTIGANKQANIAVTIRGTVYARRIPPISPELRAKMPNIIFSESY